MIDLQENFLSFCCIGKNVFFYLFFGFAILGGKGQNMSSPLDCGALDNKCDLN